MAGEAEIVVSATGQTSVTIWTTKLDDNIDKPIVNIPIPRQKSAMDAETEPTTYLIDIGRVNQAVTIQGMLVDETSESALTKKIIYLR
jgi:hypothetical protein